MPNRIIIRVIRIFVIIFLLNYASVYHSHSMAEAKQDDQKENIKKAGFVPNEIIIKVKNVDAFDKQAVKELLNKYKVKVRPLLKTVKWKGIISAPGTSVLSAMKDEEQKRRDTVIEKLKKQGREIPRNATIPDFYSVFVLTLDSNADLPSAIEEFAQDTNIAYAHRNYIMDFAFTPDDPYFSSATNPIGLEDLWNLKQIQMPLAWDITQGEGTVVAVLDTGLDYTHEDIENNVWINEGEFPDVDTDHNGIVTIAELQNAGLGDTSGDGQVNLKDLFGSEFENGVDDDRNGYIDDFMGYGTLYNSNEIMDKYGHGTHVSGIIAAQGNNNIGIIGVAPKTKIMTLRGGDATTGTVESLAEGFNYAVENGADIMNGSWRLYPPAPSAPVLEDAIRKAYALGAVVVLAAGNSSGMDVHTISPQNMRDPKPIVVSAWTNCNDYAEFSNTGVLVDVAAPGAGKSCSDWATNAGSVLSLAIGDGYQRQMGTSMAAPHVAGLAALVKSLNRGEPYSDLNDNGQRDVNEPFEDIGTDGLVNKIDINGSQGNGIYNPGFSSDEIRQVLNSSTDFGISSPNPPSRNLGHGMINAKKALEVKSVLTVQIKSPKHGTVLYKNVGPAQLEGIVSGANLQDIKWLFSNSQYSASDYFNWQEIPLQPNALLTPTWNIQLLLNGFYVLRLIGTTNDGKVFDDVIHITIMDSPENPSPMRISNDSFATQSSPAISGDWVLWTDDRNLTSEHPNNYDIYGYHIPTKKEMAITTDVDLQASPHLFNHKAVWQGTNPSYNIFSYDLDNLQQTPQQLSRTYLNSNPTRNYPVISSDKVVWEDSEYFGGRGHIRFSDFANSNYIPIGSSNPKTPYIFNNLIVWTDNRNGNNDIYLYDLNEHPIQPLPDGQDFSIPISTAPNSQENPKISGNYIVWQDYRDNNWDIYWCEYNRSTRTCPEQRLTIDLAEQKNPKIDGGRIVWEDYRNGTWDIYTYNIASPEEGQRRVTTHPSTQVKPAVHGSRIVWIDYRTIQPEVYMVDLAGPADQTAPTIPESLKVLSAPQDNFVELSWLASADHSGQVTYQIFRKLGSALFFNQDDIQNYSLAGETNLTTFRDTGVTPENTYTYFVKAKDPTGNISFPSNLAEAMVTGQSNVSITLTSPNGGESWEGGTAHDITWTTTGSIDFSVTLEYSTDGGRNYSNMIAYSVDGGIGRYAWTVPSTFGNLFRVRVSSTSNSSIYDSSDANFRTSAAGTISLTNYNAGEVMIVGTYTLMTWTKTGSLGPVKIEHSTDGGVTYPNLIVGSADGNTGYYNWNTPNVPGRHNRVKITSLTNPTITDASDGDFIITRGLILHSPIGGEVWDAGTTKNITWERAYWTVGTAVKIEYSTDGGATYPNLITASAPTSHGINSYQWTIPSYNAVGTGVRVKVTSVSDGSYTDSSPADFTVRNIAPFGTVTVNNNASFTKSVSVTLSLSATVTGSTVTQMQFSNDNVTWSTPETFATSKSWTLSAGDGMKTVYVKFKSAAGNWSPAFSDTILLDTTKPTTTSTLGATTATTITLNANTTDPAPSSNIDKIVYNIRQSNINTDLNSMGYGALSTVTQPAGIDLAEFSTSTDVAKSWFGAAGVVYTVTGYDKAGNALASAKYWYDKVTGTLKDPDLTAPNVPNGLTVSNGATAGTANLSWDPSPDYPLQADVNNEYVNYKIYRNGVLIKSTARILRTAGQKVTYTDTNLVAGVNYSYQVLARDMWSKESAKCAPFNFTLDPLAPTVPTGLQANQYEYASSDGFRAQLTWGASTVSGGGTVSYEIYRNDVKVGTTTSTTYMDTKLAETTYYYKVRAVANTNHYSGYSNTASVTLVN